MSISLEYGETSEKHKGLSPKIKGYGAMVLVLVIWSGFALTVRSITSSPLTMVDVALIRFSTSLLILAPFIKTHFRAIWALRISDWLLILLGGAPFLFLASIGASSTPTAYVGSILAGTPPLLIAICSFIVYRKRPTGLQLMALLSIAIGILVMIAGGHSHTQLSHGVVVLLGAAWLWAGYTFGLKRVGLHPIAAAIVLAASSLVVTGCVLLFNLSPSHLGDFSFQQALPYGIVQGIGVGVISTISFCYAVQQLGSQIAATFGAMSPGLTALLAMVFFNEPLSFLMLVGIGLTAVGVLLTSRVIDFSQGENHSC
ncbi:MULTISPECIES: DMT family transporter [unclassified Vibrio]|uniref:DMT family transporter n=1 Tax=Vibrio sp. HB236076 TaxID=3232307 RepID=A0AB39HID5_9VIBR|nr:DMT family transporter [Vibrio sp. HB161653]MDP5254674.1 DMT family transporter [Vibrio sp. HB161653]